jgi:hypothetical protein
MKAIQTQAVISSLRALTDGGLSLTVHTPELTPEEKAEFMRLQNINIKALFNPLEYKQAPKITVDKELDRKSQSERIRNCLFVLWKQEGEPGDFSQFYRKRTEDIISYIKRKLD